MDVIYLDNAATSWPKPPAVAAAVADAVTARMGNPGRATHSPAQAATSSIEATRRAAAAVLGAGASRTVFTCSGTDALAVAVHALLLGAGNPPCPRVITTQAEHNALRRPLVALAEQGAIELITVPCDAHGTVDPATFIEALATPTRLVAMVHASNVTGVVQDIESIGHVCRDRGALLLVDAAQTAGLLPIDLANQPIDAVATPGHKAMLGPMGTGVVAFGERCGDGEALHVWRPGGGAGDSEADRQPGQLPERLEAGTPNLCGLAGLAAGLANRPAEPDAMLAHELALLDRLIDATVDLPGLTWHAAPRTSPRVATACLTVDGLTCADLATILDGSFGIAVRDGLHCAPGTHRALGTLVHGGATRFSPGPYTTEAQVDAVVAALSAVTGG